MISTPTTRGEALALVLIALLAGVFAGWVAGCFAPGPRPTPAAVADAALAAEADTAGAVEVRALEQARIASEDAAVRVRDLRIEVEAARHSTARVTAATDSTARALRALPSDSLAARAVAACRRRGVC